MLSNIVPKLLVILVGLVIVGIRLAFSTFSRNVWVCVYVTFQQIKVLIHSYKNGFVCF